MEAKNTVGTLIKVLAIITYCCGAFLFLWVPTTMRSAMV